MKYLIIFSGTLFLILQSCQEVEQPSNDLKVQISELEQSLDSLKNVNGELEEKLDSLRSLQEPETQDWFDPNIHASHLVKQGIDDPAQHIMQSLQEKTELIPIEGVLGGNMAFRRMKLLGEKWIIAEYDDGHILGRAIYEYQLNKGDNRIEFKLLDSTSE